MLYTGTEVRDPIKTKKRVFEIKAKAVRSRPLGLPRNPRTEWEVSRRPPAKRGKVGDQALDASLEGPSPRSLLLCVTRK